MAPARPVPRDPGVRRSLALSALLHGAVVGAAAAGLFAATPAERPPVILSTALVVVPVLEAEETPRESPLPENRAEAAPEFPEIVLEDVAASPPPDPGSEGTRSPRTSSNPGSGVDIASLPAGRIRGRLAPGRSGAAEGSAAAAGAAAPGPAAPPSSADPAVPEFRPPRPLPGECLPPAYPSRARGAQGTVRLRVAVGADGSVEGIAVAASSGNALLDEAALAAVRAWRFAPAREGGAAVAAAVLQPVVFGGGR